MPVHSCQPAEFVIPNGGGFGRGACPLKLKKMAHMYRNGKRMVACSACAVAQIRERADVLCLRNSGEKEKKEGKKKKKSIFIIWKQNSSFGNSHSNFDFLIIRNIREGWQLCQHSTVPFSSLIKQEKHLLSSRRRLVVTPRKVNDHAFRRLFLTFNYEKKQRLSFVLATTTAD